MADEDWNVGGFVGSLNIFERMFLRKVEDALRDAGEYVLEQSSREVPHEVGDLQDSGRVTVDGDTCAISYDTPYAVVQHEDMTFRHDEGRKAKYLEDPLNAASNGPIQRILGDKLGKEFS